MSESTTLFGRESSDMAVQDALGLDRRMQDGRRPSWGRGTVERRVRSERRSLDPINTLARSLGSVATSAVDAFEIAAAIEARGINDDIARTHYGRADVFTLANDIYRLVPLRPKRPKTSSEFDHLGRKRVLRGTLFALPGIFFFPLAKMVTVRSAALVLIAVTIVGWAASQGISGLAHAQNNRWGNSAMLRCLRVAFLVGVSLIAAVGAVAISFGAHAMLTVAACAQAVYILVSIVLFTLDEDSLLSQVLIPGVVLIVALVLIPGVPVSLPVGALLACIALLSVAALKVTKNGDPSPYRIIDVRRATMLALYGASLGTLVAAPLAMEVVRGAQMSKWLALAALPITLSMGIAERRFIGYRIRVRDALNDLQHPAEFASRSTGYFREALVSYTTWLLGITVVCVGIGAIYSRPDDVALQVLASYTLLGPGLFAALVVAAAGRAMVLSAILAVAVVAFVALGGSSQLFVVVSLAVAVMFVWTGARTSRSITGAR